jgi:hypothetical protein
MNTNFHEYFHQPERVLLTVRIRVHSCGFVVNLKTA